MGIMQASAAYIVLFRHLGQDLHKIFSQGMPTQTVRSAKRRASETAQQSKSLEPAATAFLT